LNAIAICFQSFYTYPYKWPYQYPDSRAILLKTLMFNISKKRGIKRVHIAERLLVGSDVGVLEKLESNKLVVGRSLWVF
jgi:hypothetical protein